jgi:hypothetical protein
LPLSRSPETRSWPVWSCPLISVKLWRTECGRHMLLDNFLISEICVTATFMNRKEWLKVQSWWYSYLYSCISRIVTFREEMVGSTRHSQEKVRCEVDVTVRISLLW